MTHYYLIGVTTPTGGQGLTYSSQFELVPGQLVELTVRNRPGVGLVLGEQAKPKFATKELVRLLEFPPLPAPLLKLGQWLSEYYSTDQSHAWQTIIPAGALKNRRARKTAEPITTEATTKLTDKQNEAALAIVSSPQTTNLLYGITGSGKTEVYQELVRIQLEKSRSAIILVPEIALTPQTLERFQAWFGDKVIITHSRLAEAERFAIWQRVSETTEPLVIVGPRSALFLPLIKVGLIVVDEAHETSYKQDQAPRYETVVVAAKLAHLHGAKLILGSATPGLREAYLAEQGTIKLVKLTERYNQLVANKPIIVDLKDKSQFRINPIFSQTLLDYLKETYDRGRQSLLFLNRRGSASSQICTNCQHVTLCPRCMLALVLHADEAKMVCHICNFRQAPPAVCPQCGQAELRFLGLGTKRIVTELERLFPKARIARLDKDSLGGNNMAVQYAALANHEVDFLVGTQMIAKGLDLPEMETIGVILADSSLYLPDFSATERTFSLLTQVSGRAGRADHPGRTIIQTYSPNHPVILALSSGDYWDFAHAELAERRLLGYPPFAYLLKLSYGHKQDAAAEEAAERLAKQLAKLPQIEVIGPAPAFRRFAGGSSHWQLIIKAKTRRYLQTITTDLPTGWTGDLDPINLL